MTLTTPVLNDDDAVFPGENWFLYWKTSSSLWENKLATFNRYDKIVIPLNWSFHSDSGENYDFGVDKPETDLVRLIKIIENLGKEAVIFLPMTPFPFLTNGGVPHLLARNISLNGLEVARAISDAEGNLNKIYSFFDPRVFKAYRRFLGALGQYISSNGIASGVWGIEGGHIEQGVFKSYIHDRSPVFHKSFSRFLSVKKGELESSERLIESPDDEQRLSNEFTTSIADLYLEAAKEILASNWESQLQVTFLGGDDAELMYRANNNFVPTKYVDHTFQSICQDAIPSSVLIPNRIKTGVVKKILDDLVCGTFIPKKLSPDLYDNEDTLSFRPLNFFEVFEKDVPTDSSQWSGLGLWHYLEHCYKWNYRVTPESRFFFDEEAVEPRKVYFFHADQMDSKAFHSMLKIFMAGGRVLLNRAGIADQFAKRLEVFLLENDLKVDRVNYISEIMNVSLGESRLVIFDGDKLADTSKDKIFQFWDRLFGTFGIVNASITPPVGVEYYWRTRAVGPSELNYEEVRRLSVYNKSSYKKKTKVGFSKNFALMKIVDEINCSITSQPSEVEIELMPGGSVSLDFGIFF